MSIFDNGNFKPVQFNPNEITYRQERLIENICKLLKIEFNGTTKQEAFKFIKNNLQQYLQLKEELSHETNPN